VVSILLGSSLASLVSLSSLGSIDIANADARLNAPSAAGTRVNSDAESLLRYGLPITNKEIRDIQGSIESVKMNLKTRRVGFAKSDLNSAKDKLVSQKDKIFAAVPSNHLTEAKESYNRLLEDIEPLDRAMTSEQSSGSGSLQERENLDIAFVAQSKLSKELSTFEELMVPDGYKRDVPAEYDGLPRLQGRAEVSMVLKKPDGSQYNVDGKLYDKVELKMVIDGYNAPITGGNFVDLVNKGFYNGKKITRADGFVVQTGDADPEGTVHGYVPQGSSAERTIPVEIALKGEKELLYGTTSEDEGKGYAATVLPFQSYGALGMARSEYENDSASSQFFWLLFESDLTPAGKNLLDGRYSCFGYTVENADLVKGVAEGDIISSAKVIKGKLEK
jgi:cyclophilin family peptidyl-prolyl cis-trans isomerase